MGASLHLADTYKDRGVFSVFKTYVTLPGIAWNLMIKSANKNPAHKIHCLPQKFRDEVKESVVGGYSFANRRKTMKGSIIKEQQIAPEDREKIEEVVTLDANSVNLFFNFLIFFKKYINLRCMLGV